MRRILPAVLALALTACEVPASSRAGGAGPLELGAYAGGSTADFPLPPKAGGDPRWVAAHATDGDPNSYWGATPFFPAWISVDLGAIKAVDRVKIRWETNTYPTEYDVEVSKDGRTWKPALQVRSWGGNVLDERPFPAVDARYVRIYGLKGDNHYAMWLGSYEVYGPDAPATDLARGRRATSSGDAPLDVTDAVRADVAKAIDDGDARYRAGDYAAALARWREVYDPWAYSLKTNLAGYPRDQWTYTQLRVRVLAADFRIRQGAVRPAATRKLVLLTLPETDMAFPATSLGPASRITRRLDEESLEPWRDGWFWFAESFLALTDGQVGWEISEERLDGHKAAKVYVDDRGAGQGVFAQLGAGDIAPAIDDRLAARADADMYALIWPGSHEGFQRKVTNGGSGTVFVRQPDGSSASRPFIVSEGHDMQPYSFYNTAAWAHHEFFHQLEGLYYEQEFPKEPLHSFFSRDRWPADFSGYGEWDFYENVYRRRIRKADQAARVEWASNRYPSGSFVRTLIAQKAVDGDRQTRWSSRFNDAEWIYVDLGKAKAVDRVAIAWEYSFAKAYKVQGYNATKKVWTTLRTITNGDGGDDDVRFKAYRTRYVRVSTQKRGTPYVNSIYELAAYGPDAPGTNLALNQPAKASSVEGDLNPGQK